MMMELLREFFLSPPVSSYGLHCFIIKKVFAIEKDCTELSEEKMPGDSILQKKTHLCSIIYYMQSLVFFYLLVLYSVSEKAMKKKKKKRIQ